MTYYLIVRDSLGEFKLTYEEMCKYHGNDFLGGVALAFKVLELAFIKLLKTDEVAERSSIFLVIGTDPPGIIDGFEYVTRALSQRRIIIHKKIEIGEKSVFGHYYFEVHYLGNKISIWLKGDILPEGFTSLAKKCISGLANDDELNRWKSTKLELGDKIISSNPMDLFEFSEVMRCQWSPQ